MAFEPTETCRGVRFLSKNDPVLAEVVRNVGAFTLKADPRCECSWVTLTHNVRWNSAQCATITHPSRRCRQAYEFAGELVQPWTCRGLAITPLPIDAAQSLAH